MKLLSILFLLFSSMHCYENFDLYKIKGAKQGSTLLIFAGVHGNEPGGYFAASILATHYTISEGTLWVVPNTNKESIIKDRRGIHGDLNRKFSTISDIDKDLTIVNEIKTLILDQQVDLILNLHDGHGYFREEYTNTIFNPGAWGQTCVIDQIKLDQNSSYGDLECIAQKVSSKLNQHLLQDHHSFNVRNTKTKKNKNEMQHSLTYFAINHNKPAFAIETSKELKTTAQKVYYQLRAIEAFMQIMGNAPVQRARVALPAAALRHRLRPDLGRDPRAPAPRAPARPAHRRRRRRRGARMDGRLSRPGGIRPLHARARPGRRGVAPLRSGRPLQRLARARG